LIESSSSLELETQNQVFIFSLKCTHTLHKYKTHKADDKSPLGKRKQTVKA